MTEWTAEQIDVLVRAYWNEEELFCPIHRIILRRQALKPIGEPIPTVLLICDKCGLQEGKGKPTPDTAFANQQLGDIASVHFRGHRPRCPKDGCLLEVTPYMQTRIMVHCNYCGSHGQCSLP